jgi:hypothetical protein
MNQLAVHLELIEKELGEAWLPRIYRERIRTMRTRAYQFALTSKRKEPEILHSLLGIELQVGRRRMLCPDLATARYLAVFARIGCQSVAIPYDITRISQAADELESSWHRMLLLNEKLAADRSPAFRARVRGALIAKVRNEIDEAGAGARNPEFNRNARRPAR